MFNLEIEPSYDLIFSNTTEEKIFEHYLGIPVRKGLYSNPMREDNHPSASFFKTKKGLYFRDHALNENYGCIDVVKEMYACGYLEAINIICNDFGLVDSGAPKNPKKIDYTNSTIEESESALIQCAFKKFNEKELKWWASYGITEATLKLYNVFSIKNLFVNGNVRVYNSSERSLVFGYYFGKDNGLEQWKIYMPGGRIKFYCNTVKFNGVKQLTGKSDTLFITSSMKDVMTLHEAGYEAIAPQSESVNISPEIRQKLEKMYDNIYVFYDHDDAGFKRAKIIKEAFGWDYITTESSSLKDPSDYSREFGIKKLREHVEKSIKR